MVGALRYDSVWPFFICLGLLLMLSSTPLFRSADTAPDPGGKRLVTMDGLRGFLALAVVFHHAIIYHEYLIDGVWTLPASHFYLMLGPLGVGLFFMITGFLFWGQLVRAGGRPSWIGLYTGRVFRLGPLYTVAVLLMFGGVALATGGVLHVSMFHLLKPAVEWLMLGLWRRYDLNGYEGTSLLLANVTYTLRYEWWFYLSLPVLAVFTRRRGGHLYAVLGAFAALQIYFWTQPGGSALAGILLLFLSGMLVASLRERGLLLRQPSWLPDWMLSAVLLLLLVLAMQLEPPVLDTRTRLLLGVVFYLVVSGADLFGLLRSRPAIRLGDASYGIYLLQGLVLAAVLRPRPDRAWSLGSPWAYWSLCLLAAGLLVVVSAVGHYWIEQPGIRLGKRVCAALKARLAGSVSAAG